MPVGLSRARVHTVKIRCLAVGRSVNLRYEASPRVYTSMVLLCAIGITIMAAPRPGTVEFAPIMTSKTPSKVYLFFF